jgi:hypothetical protein
MPACAVAANMATALAAGTVPAAGPDSIPRRRDIWEISNLPITDRYRVRGC